MTFAIVADDHKDTVRPYFTNFERPQPKTRAVSFRLARQRNTRAKAHGLEETMAAVETLSPPLPNGTTTPEPTTNGTHAVLIPLDPLVFRTYLLTLLPPFFGASAEELETIFDSEFEDRVSKFSTEAGGALYIAKLKDDVEGALYLTRVS